MSRSSGDFYYDNEDEWHQNFPILSLVPTTLRLLIYVILPEKIEILAPSYKWKISPVKVKDLPKFTLAGQ